MFLLRASGGNEQAYYEKIILETFLVTMKVCSNSITLAIGFCFSAI